MCVCVLTYIHSYVIYTYMHAKFISPNLHSYMHYSTIFPVLNCYKSK